MTLPASHLAVDRPPLIMPDAVAAHLRVAYAAAGTILEYGMGGSTAMAAEMSGKTVFSVESDAGWIARMRAWFDTAPPAAALHLHHGDIGPTGEWGHPARQGTFKRWAAYPHSVWDRDDLIAPDVVLIDGRFRAACFATVAFRITRPTVVLFDDYADRPAYHDVERLARPVALIDRMARFEISPRAMTPEHMEWFVRVHLRPL